jgi:hypothetical protein
VQRNVARRVEADFDWRCDTSEDADASHALECGGLPPPSRRCQGTALQGYRFSILKAWFHDFVRMPCRTQTRHIGSR